MNWPLILALPPMWGAIAGACFSLYLGFAHTGAYPAMLILVPVALVIGVIQGGAAGLVAAGTGLLSLRVSRTRAGQSRAAAVGAIAGAMGASALARILLIPDLLDFLPLLLPWTALGSLLLWILLAKARLPELRPAGGGGSP